MRNEILLLLSLIIIYGSVLLWYRLFGVKGLISFNVLATICANIEVIILVNAFGMEQTLGNILFGSTFLVTDILSEVSGKKAANKAVNMSILTSFTFILISQSWLYYLPSSNDLIHPSIVNVFSNTPRMMLASLFVYAVSQKFDVWLYHKWWDFTDKLCGSRKKYLWVRNNGSTLISQLLNTFLFTLGAFAGTYAFDTLVNIMWSSYIIFIFTSIADTPIVYLARRMKLPESAME